MDSDEPFDLGDQRISNLVKMDTLGGQRYLRAVEHLYLSLPAILYPSLFAPEFDSFRILRSLSFFLFLLYYTSCLLSALRNNTFYYIFIIKLRNFLILKSNRFTTE